MSLHVRLNLAIGLLTLMIVGALIGAVLLDAQPRMKAENATMMRLIETTVTSSLVPITNAPDPRRELHRLVENLQSLRHVTVALASDPPAPNAATINPQAYGLLEDEPPAQVKIPVNHAGSTLDTIVITARPSDELDELWSAARRILEYGLALTAGMVMLNSLVIRWSLAPVLSLQSGLAGLERGNYATAVPEEGPPEIRGICQGLNKLAKALLKAQEENRTLSAHIIHVQDEERRDIARELHDELGPSLFSLRTKTGFLCREIEKTAPDQDKTRRLGAEIVEHVDFLQKTNRRVLHRLTPPGLTELGLEGAIGALAAVWRREQPDIDLALHIIGDTSLLDETLTLTAFRIVQEGLTNAYRHARAAHIEAAITIAQATAGASPDYAGAAHVVHIRISDDGIGRSPGVADGFGLTSMRDRVRALGGTLDIVSHEAKGLTIKASLPVASAPA